jgi:hypothetical protein
LINNQKTHRIVFKFPKLYILFNRNNKGLKDAILNIKGYQAIKENGLLDIEYYLKNNLDVQKSGIDPIIHYMYHGFKEDRNPNPSFNADYYLKSNIDVKYSKINPLIHYALYGIKEGRKINENEKILENEVKILQNRLHEEQTKLEDAEIKMKEIKEDAEIEINELKVINSKYESVPTYKNHKLALKGGNGYLFLINDSNNEIRQHFDYSYINNFNPQLFIKNLEYKKDYCNKNNIGYYFFIIPDKSLICRDYLPFQIKLIKRNCDLIKEFVPDFAQNLDHNNYFKNESHINYYAGKELSFNYLNFIDKDFKREDLDKLMEEQISYVNYEHFGDLLADKNWSYSDEEKERYIHEKAVRFENKFIVDLSKNLPDKFKTVRLRKTEYYMNNNSYKDLKVLIFRDSTLNYLKDVLSVYFKEMLLYWDHWFFNKDLIEWYKPDIILEIRTERFLENMKYEIK